MVALSSSPAATPVALPSLTLEHASHYHQAPGVHPRPVQIPPHYERIELVTGGQGWIADADNLWKEVLPGDLIWNKPGDWTIGRSNFEDPYRCLAITLITKNPGGLGVPRFSHWPNLEEMNSFAHETVKLFMDETFDRRVLRDYLVSRLLFCVNLHYHQADSQLPAPIRRALDWIQRNYASRCSIEELARAAGWSPAHLHHAFQRHLRVTPHQAVLRERLRAAREQLVSTAHPMKQIATECGFADASAFNHVFKEAIGLTPGAYRKRYLSLS